MKGKDLEILLRQDRGQFLDFVSAYDSKKQGSQPRLAKELAREIARLAGGMANADGGTLLVGVEKDKSVTGIPFSEEESLSLVNTFQELLSPPLYSAYEIIRLGNLLLLKLEIAPAVEVHRIAVGRTFYRIATENPSIPPEQIHSLKEAKRSFYYERQTMLEAAWEDLDTHAIESFSEKIGDGRSIKTLMAQAYHLLNGSEDKPRLTIASLLLFAKDPMRWHPRSGIDFIKYEGNERRHGASFNVVKRIRFEAPLCKLIDEAVGRIKEHIKERILLHDLFFRERMEYPTFAWQEAIVNAVAHRDYSLTGAPIEISMFDDRIEIRSPGLLPSPITLDHLRLQKMVHFSRNPLLIRVLGDLGYVREIGEGVPRMFNEMEHHGLRPPEFSVEGFYFTVILRNTPIYDEDTVRWLNRFGKYSLNFRQRRLLVYAYVHGKSFSTSDYQRITEVDRDTAYREIKSMIKLGIVGPLKPKSRSYRIIEQI